MNNNKIVREFLGAGNLIFPPSIGLDWLSVLACFILTGMVLPILGVAAVLNSKGKFE